jgi:hypothetical protein
MKEERQQTVELRAKVLKRAFELLAKKINCSVESLIHFIEGRTTLPDEIFQRLKTEVEETDPLLYEIVENPLDSSEFTIFRAQIHQLSLKLGYLLQWFIPYGLERKDNGYCFLNKKGIQISPFFRTIDDAVAFLEKNDLDISPSVVEKLIK